MSRKIRERQAAGAPIAWPPGRPRRAACMDVLALAEAMRLEIAPPKALRTLRSRSGEQSSRLSIATPPVAQRQNPVASASPLAVS